MSIEVNKTNIICTKCGTSYSRRKGYFAVSYSVLHKGIGFLPICKNCVEKMFDEYMQECNNTELAVHQMCRKLDLYWNKKIFDMIEKKTTTRTIMTTYIAKLCTNAYAGKSYDNTLIEEGHLWDFNKIIETEVINNNTEAEDETDNTNDYEDIDEEVIMFWGKRLKADDYRELERKRTKWLSGFQDNKNIDVATDSLIKQICLIELDIDKKRAGGGEPTDKMLKAYMDLLGSANLKPVQKQKDDNDASFNTTPLGVWLYRWENNRPLPDEYNDSKLLKYVFTWMGHVLRMLGKKNMYEKLYQDEIDRLRVEKPEYEGDDETLMMEYMEEDSSALNG